MVHRSLEACIQTFTPISGRIATLTLRTTGGSITLVLVYLPYEAMDNQDLRVANYDLYAETIGAAQKKGPVIGIGDHNTSVRYRVRGEQWVGRHLYGPRNDVLYESDEEARRQEGNRLTVSNRDLLADLCTTRGMRFANSYLAKRQTQKITFHRKGSARMPELPIDYSVYREIDLTLISAEWLRTVENIRSRTGIQVGASTHIIQETTLCLPRFALPKRVSRAGAFRGKHGEIQNTKASL